jgi:hypothetical protein
MSKSLKVSYVVIPSVKAWLFLLLRFVVIMMPLLSMQSFVVTVLAFIIEKCFFIKVSFVIYSKFIMVYICVLIHI